VLCCRWLAIADAVLAELEQTGLLVAGRCSADSPPAAGALAGLPGGQARQWARELGLTTDSLARTGLADQRSPDPSTDLLSSPFA
jgi:hypothetical protein